MIEIKNGEKINEIIQSSPNENIFLIKNGIYNEKIEIKRPNITILGESVDGVIITNHDFYHKIMADYNECNTFRTYTIYIGSDNVTIKNLTIENSSVPSSKYGQAVALHADGNNLHFENVVLRSAQDTLFTGPLPENLQIRYKDFLPDYMLKDTPSKQFYKNCTIIGDVDFIFGGATALFLDCKIISLSNNHGYISAPSHKKDCPYGFLFYNCELINEANAKNVYLARPWRDYGCAAFFNCKYDNHIIPEGFNKWAGTERDKTARFYEYNSNHDLSKRVEWSHILSKDEMEKYYNDYMSYINN